MLYSLSSVCGAIMPVYPPEDPVVAQYLRARNRARERFGPEGWRWSGDRPGGATDVFEQLLLEEGLPPTPFQGTLASVSLLVQDRVFNNHRVRETIASVVFKTREGTGAAAYDALRGNVAQPFMQQLLNQINKLERGTKMEVDVEMLQAPSRRGDGHSYLLPSTLVAVNDPNAPQGIRLLAQDPEVLAQLKSLLGHPSLKGKSGKEWRRIKDDLFVGFYVDLVKTFPTYRDPQQGVRKPLPQPGAVREPVVPQQARRAPAPVAMPMHQAEDCYGLDPAESLPY